jgi:predicted  nucleic acid-binding Zn-ribbon protein
MRKVTGLPFHARGRFQVVFFPLKSREIATLTREIVALLREIVALPREIAPLPGEIATLPREIVRLSSVASLRLDVANLKRLLDSVST